MGKFIKKAAIVTAGGLIQGLGMGLFLFPHSIPSGGAGGIAVLLNYFFYLDMGFALWAVNFSMLVLAIKYLGNKCTLWTMFAITVTSLSIYFSQKLIAIPFQNVWIDLLTGSLFLGAGVGLLLRQGVSNGGVGVLALIISSMRGILPGRPLFWINGVIFLLTASIIKWEIIIQALASQWISTKIVDVVFKIRFYYGYPFAYRKK
ncbi:YitT family protein [Bacillus sp. B-jedd]|uniref:YitT family protein n=1 Tax=Bacillus sp. B-jedd TaxID=1476857 RepID=UPI000515633E|nr:YitT family protein [Bacillus sp. B-jedd]CEG27456.1 sporulation membrane protein YitE [Bacillus sp. B-jedd]